ncbi:hypothetical protein [Nodularia spumigena]|uniref:hypothetical protein n=1 Tax=Nodularia spumigena TaxID=70799 RepID=UPI00232D83AD|nr:hypothetical protein [Nodularia spumigena]
MTWFTLIINTRLKTLDKITAIASGGALPIALYSAEHFVTNSFNSVVYNIQTIITINKSRLT